MAYYLLPWPVAWVTLSLMSRFMRYHDLGVNMGANNLHLLLFVAVPLVAGLYAIAIVARGVFRRWLPFPRWALTLASLTVVAAGWGAFWLQTQRFDLDGSPRPQSMATFLADWLRHALDAPRRP